MDHPARLAELQRRLAAEGLDGALISQSRDLFYYTGQVQPAYLLVGPADYRLFVLAGWDLAREQTGLPAGSLSLEPRPDRVFEAVRTGLGHKARLGLEMDVLPANRYLKLAEAFPGFELADVSPLILGQRRLKDDEEIAVLRRAGRAVRAGLERVREVLRPGLSELELAAELEMAQRLAGHEGDYFIRVPDFFMSRGPLGSGPNLISFSGQIQSLTGAGLSAALPTGPSRRIIQPGDLVVIDVPVLLEGYHAEMTRTFVAGRADQASRRLFAGLREIFDKTLAAIRPGLSCGRLFETSQEAARSLGLDREFLGLDPGRRSSMVGHGLGLEVNEPPILSVSETSPLEAGLVLALEMHLQDRNGRVVKLEDTLLVGPAGAEVLTPGLGSLVETQS